VVKSILQIDAKVNVFGQLSLILNIAHFVVLHLAGSAQDSIAAAVLQKFSLRIEFDYYGNFLPSLHLVFNPYSTLCFCVHICGHSRSII
jgi:hypothetical protein